MTALPISHFCSASSYSSLTCSNFSRTITSSRKGKVKPCTSRFLSFICPFHALLSKRLTPCLFIGSDSFLWTMTLALVYIKAARVSPPAGCQCKPRAVAGAICRHRRGRKVLGHHHQQLPHPSVSISARPRVRLMSVVAMAATSAIGDVTPVPPYPKLSVAWTRRSSHKYREQRKYSHKSWSIYRLVNVIQATDK